jgi:DNA modification methylase
MESVLEKKLGQINQGDCIAGMKALPSESVNLVFADPPFNIGYDYDEYDDQLDSNQYLAWSRDWISEVYRVLHDSGAFWLAIGDEYAAELKVEAQKIGFQTRSWVVWYYTFGVHCKLKFTRSHAHLFHFVKNPKSFVFNRQAVAVPSARQLVYGDKRANPSGRMPDDTWILRPQDCLDGFTPDEDTWYFPRVAGTFKERAGFHGCQMPEQLLGRIILSCSNPGDVVMDPFSGSGTTLTVAKKKGRRFLGFEMSKDYVKLGTKRIEAACAGDELEGSPDPKLSAPATDSPKARRTKNAISDQQGFGPLFEFSKIDSETDGIVEAFARSNRGYSVDRLVADPILNEDFQTQCDRLGIPGTQAERNRFLFRIRKSGKLKQSGIETSNITSFDWQHLDPFLYASEIAWRRVSELYANASLEEILCDPRLAKQFDEVAMSQAEGYSQLEYRWAALKLRKQGSTARKRGLALSLDKFTTEDWLPVCDLRLSRFGARPGLYAIRCNEDYLYAGETSNIRMRLGLQLSESAIGRWPAQQQERSELNIAIREVATVEDARLARQSQLLSWYRPRWNFNELI